MKNSRWRNFIRFGAVAVALMILAFVLYPRPIRVETALVTQGELEVTVDDDGETRVRERYTLLSPLAGKLVRIALHPGDQVLRGESELVAIEPTDPNLLDARTLAESEARVKAAESTLERALEAQTAVTDSLEFARREYERGQQLIAKEAISQSEFDQLEHRFRTSGSEFRAAKFLQAIAEHQLTVARAALVSTQTSSYGALKIQSPIDGLVLKVFREDAGYVAPGTALLEIGDPTDMELKIDVLSTAATKVRPGDKVYIEHWGGSETLLGTVRMVEPSAFLKVSALGVEEKRVNVIVDFDSPLELRQSLGDGFRVEVRIVYARSSPDSRKLPSGALFRQQEQWSVYRIENGRARRRPVKIGLSSGKEMEILEGLELGDRVILYPPEKIQDGTRVAFEVAK